MVDNDVSIFFHGHDHVFAKEEVDNMIYQECPQPSDITYGSGFDNYQSSETTVVVNNSGHIRVSVSPSELTVDYIRAYLPAAGTNGTLAYSYNIVATSTDITNSQILDSFELYQNYPNPFNGNTMIQYSLEKNSKVVITIYNLIGQEIKELINTAQNPGKKQIIWDGKDKSSVKVNSGIYILRLRTDDSSKHTKLLLIK